MSSPTPAASKASPKPASKAMANGSSGSSPSKSGAKSSGGKGALHPAPSASPKRAPKRRKQGGDASGSHQYAKALMEKVGLRARDDRVITMLSEYMSRVANDLANDAKDYAAHRDAKAKVSVDDIRLAAKLERDAAVGIPRSEMIDRAHDINSRPLPKIPPTLALALPPLSDQLIHTNFTLKL
eukprot:CAMPEP_0118863220 /NCGR_PEP_ID=MMETSP1163-20130328/8159_1 /TAXON_ID=124430 /ORGANISM="Phaeomonas parva, Strain CCMP2877" /LENGTH=182 /DNA_ID=CAMNT_0006797205 /DNA_START=313 /DNA_END=858 /DNA_ORIENTATION=+